MGGFGRGVPQEIESELYHVAEELSANVGFRGLGEGGDGEVEG